MPDTTPTPLKETRSRRRRRIRIAIVAGIVVAVVAGAYTIVLRSFFSDAKKQQYGFTTGTKLARVYSDPLLNGNANLSAFSLPGHPNQTRDGVVITGNVISVDTDINTMTIRLEFVPLGAYAGSAGELKTGVPLRLLIPNALEKPSDGGTERTFPGGQQMNAQLVTVRLDGEVSNYPFDDYTALFSPTLVTDVPVATQQEVPTETLLHVVRNGFKIQPAKQLSVNSSTNVVQLTINRSFSTRFFVTFIMALMWAIAISAVAIALVLTRLGEDIGPGVLGFLGALLFALPGIRQVLPGTPPVGSLNDYLSFFWAEAFIAITLVILAATFLLREWQRGVVNRAEAAEESALASRVGRQAHD